MGTRAETKAEPETARQADANAKRETEEPTTGNRENLQAESARRNSTMKNLIEGYRTASGSLVITVNDTPVMRVSREELREMGADTEPVSEQVGGVWNIYSADILEQYQQHQHGARE